MNSRHLVDPQLLAALDAWPAVDVTADTLAAMRANSAAFTAARAAPPDPRVAIREVRIPGPAGAPDLRVLLYAPVAPAPARPAFLHVHGGGYVLGTPEISDARNQRLALEVDCVVASVDYRLAPETPHPGPVEDCYAALAWLHAHAGSLGVDPARLAVVGESAGGGLAAALALLARDRGEVPLVFQGLVYPMLDDRTAAAAEPHPYAGEFVWTARSNHFGWKSLLGCDPGSPGVSPYASPARATNLAGLPPTFLSTSALDLFVDEDLEYGRRLIRAGVPTEIVCYAGAYHGFELAPDAEVSRRSHADLFRAARAALHPAAR